MPEYLDIVDEKDKVIGKDTRENVHDRLQIHRDVHVLVINSKGEVLLQKRSMKKGDYPGYFDSSVGEHVLSGESYKEAAIRGTREELGFEPEELIEIVGYDSFSDRQRTRRRVFICHSDGPFKFNRDEVDSVSFVPVDDIVKRLKASEMKVTKGFTLTLKEYMRYQS
ncbi:MAG: NUDIX domain-containing protein [Nanoarchaeota archaeon]|nr:NUDIX domain-containing protein [Nanoarchaeota archaeon]